MKNQEIPNGSSLCCITPDVCCANMKDISNEVMEIIAAIQHFIDKTGSTEIIDKYYQTYGTYTGIVEYLKGIDNPKQEIT